MVKRDGAETRRQRIAKIGQMVQSSLHASKNGEIPLTKFIALVMYETGLTKDRILEYLEVPEKIGQIEIDIVNDIIRKPIASV